MAVRSSAVGEDSRHRFHAGLLETVLDVRDRDGLLEAAARCIASGAAPRVLAYTGGDTPVPVGLVNGRIYFNMNGLLAAPVIGALARHALGWIARSRSAG